MAFQKGISGNPNGRPKKGNTFTDMLEKVLNESFEEIQTCKGPKRINGKLIIANALYQIATDKNNAPKIRLDAINMIMNRVDGKPIQQEIMQADFNSSQNDNFPFSTEERLKLFHELMADSTESGQTKL